MKKIIAFLFAAIVAVSHADAAALALGTRELRLSGGVDFESSYGTDVALDLGYGYFMADYLEVGGLLGYADNDLATHFGAGGFVEYNIETETIVIPFVGSQLRYLDTDIDLEGAGSNGALALGLYLGVKFYVVDNLAISARFLYEVATEDIYVEEDKVNDTDYGIQLGLGCYF